MAQQPFQSAISLGQDGKYRWVYEMNLYTNPTILILLVKIFFWIFFGLWVCTTLFDSCDTGHFAESALNNGKFMGIILLVFMVIVLIGYYVYALINGGKYCVLFEMDQQGVMHKQMPKQVKKSQIISALTVMAGMMSRNPTTVGVGILSSARSEMYSSFNSVKSVKANPGRHVIKVNETFEHNQVYADGADFDFVLKFILAHVPPKVSSAYKGYRPIA